MQHFLIMGPPPHLFKQTLHHLKDTSCESFQRRRMRYILGRLYFHRLSKISILDTRVLHKHTLVALTVNPLPNNRHTVMILIHLGGGFSKNEFTLTGIGGETMVLIANRSFSIVFFILPTAKFDS